MSFHHSSTKLAVFVTTYIRAATLDFNFGPSTLSLLGERLPKAVGSLHLALLDVGAAHPSAFRDPDLGYVLVTSTAARLFPHPMALL